MKADGLTNSNPCTQHRNFIEFRCCSRRVALRAQNSRRPVQMHRESIALNNYLRFPYKLRSAPELMNYLDQIHASLTAYALQWQRGLRRNKRWSPQLWRGGCLPAPECSHTF